jgi:hypothetical protein
LAQTLDLNVTNPPEIGQPAPIADPAPPKDTISDVKESTATPLGRGESAPKDVRSQSPVFSSSAPHSVEHSVAPSENPAVVQTPPITPVASHDPSLAESAQGERHSYLELILRLSVHPDIAAHTSTTTPSAPDENATDPSIVANALDQVFDASPSAPESPDDPGESDSSSDIRVVAPPSVGAVQAQGMLELLEPTGPGKYPKAQRLWRTHGLHVTQALEEVLQLASDTLNMVPFAQLVLKGAIRAVKQLEVILSFATVFGLYINNFPDVMQEHQGVPEDRAIFEGGGVYPTSPL